jgi:hypothetical protein
MLALFACAMVGLIAANAWLLRELVALRRRTFRLALLARDGARRVRSIDSATAAAFEQVQLFLFDQSGPVAERPPQKPTFLN